MKTATSVAILLGCVMLCAAPVSAQSQGRVVRDSTTIWRTDIGLAAAVAKAGTSLEVTARSDSWYEVIVPEALGGHGERGLIALSQLQLIPGTPAPPFRQLRRGGQAPGSGGGQPTGQVAGPTMFKGFLSVNAAYQQTSHTFADGATLRANSEDGRFDTSYSLESGPAFEVVGGATVWRQLGIAVEVSRFSRATPATLTGSIPHPFFFGQPRSVSGDVSGLTREELAVHIQARGVLPIGAHFQVAVFGGPSIFRVEQVIVTGITYAESYPYDVATFSAAQTTAATGSKVGFNAGGDVAYFFTRQIGIGFSATFSEATVDLPAASGGTLPLKAGGLLAGAGLRLRF